MATLVTKKAATEAVERLIRAGIEELREGKGISYPESYDYHGRRIEWVVIGLGLWKKYCKGISAPWDHKHEETDEMLWGVLDEVSDRVLRGNGGIWKVEGDGYGSDIELVRLIPEWSQRCACAPAKAKRRK